MLPAPRANNFVETQEITNIPDPIIKRECGRVQRRTAWNDKIRRASGTSKVVRLGKLRQWPLGQDPAKKETARA